MADVKSAEQVREEHLRMLGPDLGAVYNALSNEVISLHFRWKQYRLLFADSPERVMLLNRLAGSFFRVVHDILLEDAILRVARLTDPPKSAGKDTLTLRRLPSLIEDKKLSADIDALLETVSTETTFVKDWRNKYLAHRELQLAINEGVQLLPPVSRERMECALSAIRAVIDKIYSHHWDGEFSFTDFLVHGDAETLVQHLEARAKAMDRRRERLSRGCPLPEDLEP